MTEDSVPALLASDHAEVDALFSQALSALEEGAVALSFHRLDFLWARLAVHIRAEHLSLFPAILQSGSLASGAEHSPSVEEAQRVISELRADHDFFMRELAGIINLMRPHALNPGDPLRPEQAATVRQVIEAVRSRLKSHNRLEEEKLYGWPALLLSSEANRSLVDELKRQIENLPPRFSA